MSEKKWRIASAKKIAPESRDLSRRDLAEPEDYFEMSGGDDEGPSAAAIGENVVFAANLTDEAAAEWALASNMRALEADEIDTADTEGPPVEGGEEAAGFAGGVEKAALDYQELDGMRADGVLTGVIDTGIDHYYLPNYFKGSMEGHWYFLTSTTDDKHGHGTWVSAAALAPGAKHASLKGLGDDGSGSRSTIIRAMYFFYNLAAKKGMPGVLNMSLSGGGYSQAYEDAIRDGLREGVITVCSAGNDGRQSGHTVGAPANCANAIAIAAFDHRTNRKADFSSTGAEVDCAGAGYNVLGFGLAGTERRMSGTSMSAPMVARAISVLLSQEQDVRKVRQALLSTCENTSAPATWEGHGVVKTKKALAKLAPEKPEPSPEPPAPSSSTLVILRGTGDHVRYEIHASEPLKYVESEWSSRQKNDVLSDGGKTAKGTVKGGVDTLRTAGTIVSVEWRGGKLNVEMKGD